MINSIIIMGRLTANPILKVTASGKNVCSFVVAVDRGSSKNGERQTDFLPVVAWENTAVFLEKYFLKGKMIAVTGKLQTRTYEDRGGTKRTAYEIIAKEVSFCGEALKNKEETAAACDNYEQSSYNNLEKGDFSEISFEDDLPF